MYALWPKTRLSSTAPRNFCFYEMGQKNLCCTHTYCTVHAFCAPNAHSVCHSGFFVTPILLYYNSNPSLFEHNNSSRHSDTLNWADNYRSLSISPHATQCKRDSNPTNENNQKAFFCVVDTVQHMELGWPNVRMIGIDGSLPLSMDLTTPITIPLSTSPSMIPLSPSLANLNGRRRPLLSSLLIRSASSYFSLPLILLAFLTTT